MKNHTATAMALALVAGVGAIGALPSAWASHTNCHKDFDIAASEVLAENRDLAAGAREVGRADVLMNAEETLSVRLVDPGDDGILNWTVFHDIGSGCVQYTDGGCNQNNDLTTVQTVTCTLEPPASGSKPYWVVYREASDLNAIVYKTFAEVV